MRPLKTSTIAKIHSFIPSRSLEYSLIVANRKAGWSDRRIRVVKLNYDGQFLWITKPY